jgi:pentatricopeptide repeat protein
LTRDIQKGKIIHKKILNTSLLKKDIGLGNALIDMYAKCGVLTEAHCVLEELSIRSVISWSALIAGYVQNGQGHEALNCFEQMQNEGLFPDTVTFLSLMKSCGSTGDIEKGKQIHNAITCSGLLEKEIMLANALVDMYCKCGMLEKAQVVLEAIPFRDIVSWNALITGYVQQGRCCEALKFFRLMQSEGLSPDAVTYLCTLKACGSTGSIDNGIHIHNKVVNDKLLDKSTVLGNALVAMYVKCGSLAKAHAVLEELPIRNPVSWSALVLGYAQNCLGREAMNCLERMQFEGISPDEVIFLGILSACSHSGLLDEAQIVFESMVGTYEILPSLKHHICMVMGFGFAGQFDKAMSVVEVIPYFQYPSVWLALLSTCGKWGNVNLGQLAFNHALIPDKNCPPAYVFMANIIAAASMNEESENISKLWP